MPELNIKNLSLLWLFFVFFAGFSQKPTGENENPFLVVLGIAQDGGYPQAGCNKKCCADAWNQMEKKGLVSCIALADPATNQRWIFDATPDFPAQLKLLNESVPAKDTPGIAGIFLTHGHIGHYSGLMHLGREVMGTNEIPVYAMPDMKEFLTRNGPWSQLVELKNIAIVPLGNGSEVKLNSRISITPFLVPHRSEYTETVGYKISGPDKTALYIPDIDKWERWETDVLQMIRDADIVFLDGTFFQNGELPGRDMSDIPHPFITESMEMFSALPEKDKAKVHFIHLNHTNPVLKEGTAARKQVLDAGFKIARQRQVVKL